MAQRASREGDHRGERAVHGLQQAYFAVDRAHHVVGFGRKVAKLGVGISPMRKRARAGASAAGPEVAGSKATRARVRPASS